MRLKKLVVKNFKSLRNCEVELGKFNVLVGPNASGKTNLVEVFKLLRKIYFENDTNPFLEWWGYNNVVWGRKEELPITVEMFFDVGGYDVYFETTFAGTGGSFRILREVLEVRGYFRIEKEGRTLRVFHDAEFIKRALPKLKTVKTPKGLTEAYDYFVKLDTEELLHLEAQLPSNYAGETLFPWPWRASAIFDENYETAYIITQTKDDKPILPLISPVVQGKWGTEPLAFELGGLLHETILPTLVLRQIYVQNVKEPKFSRKETTLSEDASNLVPFLYNIWLREGRLPDEIAKPLSMAFPHTRVFFQLTEDGRVMMKVFDGDLELAPPGISDGFYKTLAILTAAYLKPPLLVIDEIENSLHPETLELIFDVLRESESQVIITTHSPVVVDMTEPSDLILVDKVGGESRFMRVKDPEKIKKFLNEKGITLSEGWLYGSLINSDEQ
ncbi:AAA family ATPase [Thermococcus zilligii]|uniref:AAA family ATPase n=1 Tax=Thermococcus zilligii TaxID=54076 RepID=UPI00029A799C|nr:AAA family ATPase [Thermococcus zilligii]